MVELQGTASIWIVGVLGILLGMGLGSIVTYILAGRNNHNHNQNLQAELDQLVEQFADYREQVGQHFMHTSDLVQEMTRSYRAVYEHLATGAYHLCSNEADTPSLGHQSPDALAADSAPSVDDSDYDELAELSSLKKDIDSLLNESPRFSKVDVRIDDDDQNSIKH
jgi:uncharacterized membrane-anchored protein YhcB (DUF1043 family)